MRFLFLLLFLRILLLFSRFFPHALFFFTFLGLFLLQFIFLTGFFLSRYSFLFLRLFLCFWRLWPASFSFSMASSSSCGVCSGFSAVDAVDICTSMVMGEESPSDTVMLSTRKSELEIDHSPLFLFPVGVVCCSWSALPEFAPWFFPSSFLS